VGRLISAIKQPLFDFIQATASYALENFRDVTGLRRHKSRLVPQRTSTSKLYATSTESGLCRSVQLLKTYLRLRHWKFAFRDTTSHMRRKEASARYVSLMYRCFLIRIGDLFTCATGRSFAGRFLAAPGRRVLSSAHASGRLAGSSPLALLA